MGEIKRNRFAAETLSLGSFSSKFLLQAGEEEDSHNTRDSEPVQDVKNAGSNLESVVDKMNDESNIKLAQDLIDSIKKVGQQRNDESIKSFLAKPEILLNGTFGVGDGPTTFANFDVFAGLRTTLKANKLSGVFAIRATTVLRLQVNANPFQQGLYYLCFVPSGGIAQTTAATTQNVDWFNMHRAHPVGISQLRRVQVNLNCDSEVTLRIPYMSCTNASIVKLAGGTSYIGSPGMVFLYPIVPLNYVAGSSTATFNIWCSYEDVEVFGDVFPQAGKGKKKQGDFEGWKSVSKDDELEKKPLSSTLKVLGKGAGVLGDIPILSSVLKPLSWVLDISSGVASAFGFSKPLVQGEVCRMIREPFPYMSNADAADTSTALSLFVRNEVQAVPGFASTAQDEMSIDYLKRIWSIFALPVTWDTGGVHGDVITSASSKPDHFAMATLDGAANTVYQFTPIGLLGQLFDYFTGGLEFRFTFVATNFHSGRLMFLWMPVDRSLGLTNPSITTQQYLQRTVFDIREATEYVVKVPYVAVRPWTATYNIGNQQADVSAYNGWWQLMILDPLIAPATVPSSIKIVMEVRGGVDLHYAFPRQCTFTPIIPFALQAGEEECLQDVNFVGESAPSFSDVASDATCIGEKVTTIKQLLLRGGVVNKANAASRATVVINPFLSGVLTNTNAALADTYFNLDPFNLFSSIYCLNRGSVRIKNLYSLPTANENSYYFLWGRNPNRDAWTGATWAATPIATSSSYDFQVYPVTSLTEAQFCLMSANCQFTGMPVSLGGQGISVPQYHLFHSRANAADMYTKNYAAINDLGSRSQVFVYYTGSGFGSPTLHRSVGDDFSFGGFVSIPPLYFQKYSVDP